jgi:hypothetical protein
MTSSEKEAQKKSEGKAAVIATIAAMTGTDRALGEQLHAIIEASAPGLLPRTWYGMPAYADKDGKIIIYFRPALRFNERYMTLGFNDAAHLDEGAMWPMSFSVKELTPDAKTMISALVKKSVS